MLRVTPIYGSRWSPEGQAEEPNCTLVEYAGCRVLMNVGWWPTTRINNSNSSSIAAITAAATTTTTSGSSSSAAATTTTTTTAATAAGSSSSFPKDNDEDDEFPNLPPHDCLILTDSTLQSIGGLPMYYRQMRRKMEKNSHNHNNNKNITTSGAGDQMETAKNDSDENNNNDSEVLTFMPKIYATFPTVKMGQMTLYDQHAAISMDGGQPPYSLQDLDDAFCAVQCIKYSQQMYITPSAASAGSKRGATSSSSSTSSSLASTAATLSITAHRAGHVVGGAFYVLQRLKDETIVVLTSTYHIGRELHLDSSTLVKYGSTPDVLVTKPGGPAFGKFKALAHASSTTTNRDGDGKNIKKKTVAALPPQLVTQVERTLIDTVMGVLRREGNVLLPADAAGRSLELVYLLNRHWEKQRLTAAYNLAWLGPMVQNTAEFSRSQLEWMSTSLGQEFDSSSSSSSAAQQQRNKSKNQGGSGGGGGYEHAPFHFKATHILSSVAELNQLLQDQQSPTCVVATGLSCEGGPARDVLLQWADNPDHAIIFTDSSQCHLRRFFRPAAAAPEQQQITTTTAATTLPLQAAATTVMTVDSGDVEGELKSTLEGDLPVVVVDDDEDEQQLGNSTSNNHRQKVISPWTVSAQLLSAWGKAKAEGCEMEDSVWIDVPVPRRFPLAGAELQAFLAAEEASRQRQKEEEEKRAMLREVELAKGQLRLGEEDAGTSGSTTATTNTTSGGGGGGTTGASSSTATTTALGETTSKATRPRKKSRFDQTLFLKFSMPIHMTFEVREEAVGIGQADSTARYGLAESIGRSGEVLEDDYGIAVLPERFTDIVSGVDPSKFGASGRIGDEVLRRGFGYGVTGPKKAKGSSTGPGGTARVSEDEDLDDSDELDEKALEAVDLSEGKGIIRGRGGRPPTKVTTVPRRVEVLAEVSYVPLEGRVDAQSSRQSVRALQPRHVIVMGGPAPSGADKRNLVDEVSLLAEAAASFATGDAEIFTPTNGETAELSVGHAAYAVRLIDTPYRTREEKESGEPAPPPIEPYETKLGACTVSLLNCVATGQKVALDGSIVLAPRAKPANDIPSIYLSAGEVLLTDLRSELIAQGMKAAYSSHREGYSQLLVNGRIILRKDQRTCRMHVEGPLCEDFWTVRQIVIGQYGLL